MRSTLAGGADIGLQRRGLDLDLGQSDAQLGDAV